MIQCLEWPKRYIAPSRFDRCLAASMQRLLEGDSAVADVVLGEPMDGLAHQLRSPTLLDWQPPVKYVTPPVYSLANCSCDGS